MAKGIVEEILAGKIFIYPTDTLYGLGCNALNKEAVKKIKEIKSRDKDKPLSVIAPSFEWIYDNCIVELEIERYLPGPYTLILKKKDPNFLLHVSNSETLGIRIPDSKFTKKIQKSRVPFITTSVNLAGEPPAIKISEISAEIKNRVDYVIEADGELSGKPSTIVFAGKEEER